MISGLKKRSLFRKPPRKRRLWTRLALLAAGAAVVACAGLAAYAEMKISRLILGGLGESFSTKVYGAPYFISPRESPRRVIQRLARLEYRAVKGEPFSPGQYAWTPPVLRVYLRGFKSPHVRQEPGRFTLTHDDKNGWTVDAPQIALEPELIDELSGPRKIRREPAPESEIPALLKDAVITAEDKRFFKHWGVDPRAIMRSAWHNATKRGEPYGGSTITQQLAKNFFLSPERRYRRKIIEAMLALYLEARHSKEEILTLYLNHIYWGQDGAVGVAGVKAASQFYFGKNPMDLNLPECATLAGLIRSPYRYNPRRDPAAAKSRRDFVLRRMKDERLLSIRRYRTAVEAPLKVITKPGGRDRRDANAYFIAEIQRELLPRYGEDTLFRYGLSIYTTLDPLLQQAAARVVKAGGHQAALVAMDLSSGKVLALIGGKDFRASQFNRATQSLRQPGSAFKPFVYGAALEAGFTPASVLHDEPKDYPRGGENQEVWQPKNFNEVYHGTSTMRRALALSMNLAALDLARQLGPSKIAAFAEKLGVVGPLENSLALALGTSETTLINLVSAYAPFANGGWRVSPHLISAVVGADGSVMEYSNFERSQVLDPRIAYLMTAMLQDVVTSGTGKDLIAYGWDRPSAAKTGTTNGGRDGWFIGYTPELLAGVWVGEDSNEKANLTGAKDAMPVWAAFMKSALAESPLSEFTRPEGLVTFKIDSSNGLLARAGCPETAEELFIEGTQPTQECLLHPAGVLGWFKKVFKKRPGN